MEDRGTAWLVMFCAFCTAAAAFVLGAALNGPTPMLVEEMALMGICIPIGFLACAGLLFRSSKQ